MRASSRGALAQGLLSSSVQSPRWGARYTGPMPPAANQVLGLFDLPGDLTEAELLTVNVSSSRNIGATNGDFRLRIVYGTGAAANTLTCDLGEGVQFSIVAQTLRLELVSFAPSAGGSAGAQTYNPANGNAEIVAQVVRGGFGRGVPLTFTEPSFRLDPNATRNYSVPAFARRVFIASNIWTTVDSPIVVWALRSPANANMGGNMTLFETGQFFPIPAGFQTLQIGTTGAGSDYDYTPIWELAF